MRKLSLIGVESRSGKRVAITHLGADSALKLSWEHEPNENDVDEIRYHEALTDYRDEQEAFERSVPFFISHSAADEGAANNLVSALEKVGKRCWIAPRDIRAGKDFREEIVEAIQQCDSVVVLISKNANERPQHILRELGLAEQYGKLIKPVRLDDGKLASAFEYQLHAVHWVRYDAEMNFVSKLLP